MGTLTLIRLCAVSMTGAPKKRSVEILRQLEGEERSIYSGVMGYADVGGGGDWAVIIRSCFKFDDNPAPPLAQWQNGTDAFGFADHLRFNGHANGNGAPRGLNGHTNSASGTNGTLNGDDNPHTHGSRKVLIDEWTLAAGGAITALSDPVAEWEEMLVKVESVLPAFSILDSY